MARGCWEICLRRTALTRQNGGAQMNRNDAGHPSTMQHNNKENLGEKKESRRRKRRKQAQRGKSRKVAKKASWKEKEAWGERKEGPWEGRERVGRTGVGRGGPKRQPCLTPSSVHYRWSRRQHISARSPSTRCLNCGQGVPQGTAMDAAASTVRQGRERETRHHTFG